MAAVEMEMRGFADYRAIEWRAARGVVADRTGEMRWRRCVVRFEPVSFPRRWIVGSRPSRSGEQCIRPGEPKFRAGARAVWPPRQNQVPKHVADDMVHQP